MHVSLDRFGRATVMRPDGLDKPDHVDERDLSIGNPHQAARRLAEEEQKAVKALSKWELWKKERADRAKLMAEKRRQEAEYEIEHRRQAELMNNGDEHPLAYLAALQTLSGSHQDMRMGISGDGLSVDGSCADDRMQGFGSLGWDFNSFLSDAQKTVDSISKTVQSVTTAVAPVVQVFQQPSAAEIEAERQRQYQIALQQQQALAAASGQQVVSTPAGTLTIPANVAGFMDRKVFGLPLPVVVGGGAVALIGLALVLRRR